MIRTRFLLTVAFASLLAAPAFARDTRVEIPFHEVVQMGLERGDLDGSVRFYLAGADTPPVTQRFGEGVSNKKTNAANKSDEKACRWAALSALIRFQQSAKNQGANAVVDMVSYYKKNTWKHAQNIECRAGAIMAGVTLKGTYARVD